MLTGKARLRRGIQRRSKLPWRALRPGLPSRAFPSLTPSPWAPSLPSEALGEPQICYILDAILFLYGIILTLLYCRLKVRLGRWVWPKRQGWWWQHRFEEKPPSLERRGMGH